MKSSRGTGASVSKITGQKPGKSLSRANAAGYAKRLARKTQASTSTADIYEYIQGRTRRSGVATDLDRGETWEFGGIDDEAEEHRDTIRARLIGENDADEEIADEDDEDLDSDAAFEESDEERFAGFFSSKAKKSSLRHKKSAVRLSEVDLNEDEDMRYPPGHDSGSDCEEEGEDDEFINLLDILDGKSEPLTGSGDEGQSKTKDQKSAAAEQRQDGNDDMDEDENSSEEGSEAQEQDDIVFAPSEDEDIPDALNQLNDFVSGLETASKKRKLSNSEAAQPNLARARKRRLLKEKTEAGEENEFRVQSTGSKLNLDDLLAPLASQSSALQSLKKSTKVLASSSSKNKTLSAPLPRRAQARLDREAAYEQTKQEVDKWSETMKRIREAEHLSFPLQGQSKSRVSNLELTAKFKPTNELESAVESLLKAAKLREEDLHEAEDAMLKMNNVSVEEIAERRAELRKMRELMFRAEIKSRRVSKIKSKTYRRLRRKEKERLGEKIDEKDVEGDSETEESRLKKEIVRARERATLRHKHTGKWARKMKGREDLDEGSRRDIEEMLSRGEKLRKRIHGVGSDESEEQGDEDDEDDEDFDLEEGIAKIKQDAFSELTNLDGAGVEGNGKHKSKSVFEMKFMKDAMARQAVAANKEVDDFIKEMGGEVENHTDEEGISPVEEQDPSSGVVTVRAGGRIVFRPGTTPTEIPTTSTLAAPPSDTSSVTLQSTDLFSPPPASKRRPELSASTHEDVNPWLVRDDAINLKANKKANTVVVSKDSKTLDKAKHKVKKQTQKIEQEREKAKEDAVVEISLENVLTLSSSQPSALPLNSRSDPVSTTIVESDDESNIDSEIEAQEKAVVMKGKQKANGLKAFEQRDLVSLAFAGDNVVQSFEDAKRREISADAPRQIDMTIPGWGSWGGSGVKKAAPKSQRIKTIAGVDPKTRADYGKKHVIISEKRDKKAAKYLVKDLPYPYTSKSQFDRAMDQPLGVEWNTRQGFQRGTLPRIVKKPGIIIEPLEKLS